MPNPVKGFDVSSLLNDAFNKEVLRRVKGVQDDPVEQPDTKTVKKDIPDQYMQYLRVRTGQSDEVIEKVWSEVYALM